MLRPNARLRPSRRIAVLTQAITLFALGPAAPTHAGCALAADVTDRRGSRLVHTIRTRSSEPRDGPASAASDSVTQEYRGPMS
jgi:hypothetical protein